MYQLLPYENGNKQYYLPDVAPNKHKSNFIHNILRKQPITSVCNNPKTLKQDQKELISKKCILIFCFQRRLERPNKKPL